MNNIFKLQKRAIRFIANVHSRSHTENLFKIHNILNVHKLYENCAIIRAKTRKLSVGQLPQNRYATRFSQSLLHVHPNDAKKEITRRTFRYRIVDIYNSFPSEIWLAEVKIDTFKKKVKGCFING